MVDQAVDIEVCFERMRPSQVRECRRRADVAFLPLGTLEWHGPQNPLGLDGLKVHHVCRRAAVKLGGGAVFPPLMLGVPRDSFDVARVPAVEAAIAEALGTDAQTLRGREPHGGMDRQEQWRFYQLLVRMSLEQIAGFGFRSIYLCYGHAPLVHWVRPTAVTFTRATMMAGQVVTTDWGSECDAAGLRMDHGGRWETSLMAAADPATVDFEAFQTEAKYARVAIGHNAPDASIEQGLAWMETCAEHIAAEARWLVDHYPALPARHQHAR